jgi:predicted lysophospholipase L1 biosynthesis ABC-type transport system permease subunit
MGESALPRALEAVRANWPVIARDGLIATGGVTVLFGAFAFLAAALSDDDDLAHLLVAGGVILIVVGSVVALRIGERFAVPVLTGLTGGAFALALADMTSISIDAPERYSALRLVVLLAAILIALLAFQDGFRERERRDESGDAPPEQARRRGPRATKRRGGRL